MLASRSSNAQMLKFARCGQAGVKVQGPAFAGLRHKVEADGDSHGEAPQAHLSQHRDPHRHHRQEAHHHASHQQHEQHGQRGKEQPQQLLQMHQQTLHEHFVFQGQDGQGSSRQHPSLAQFPQQRVPQPHHHHQQQHMHIGSQGGGRYGSAYGSAPMPASAPMAYSQGTPAFAGVSYGQGQASPAFGLLLPVSLLAYSSFPCLRPPPPPSLPARRCRGSGLSCEVSCVWLSCEVGWAGMPSLETRQGQALTSACVRAQDQAWQGLGCHHRCCRAQTRRRGANARQPRPSGGPLLLHRCTGGLATRRSASWWRTTRCLGWRRISSLTNSSEALFMMRRTQMHDARILVVCSQLECCDVPRVVLCNIQCKR